MRIFLLIGFSLAILTQAQTVDDFLVITPPGPVEAVQLSTNDLQLALGDDRGEEAAPVFEFDRSEVEALVQRGDLYLQSNQVYLAGTRYVEAARLNPASRDALGGLGAVFLLSGDAVNAVDVFEYLTENFPEEREYIFNLATAYLQTGEPERAARRLRLMVTLIPEDPRIWYNLGMAELDMNNPEAALTNLDRCLELQDSHPFACLGKVRAYLAVNDEERAERELLRVQAMLTPAEFQDAVADPGYDRLKQLDWMEKAMRPLGY